jgi:selenocysteine lyase/cysteine desulfurase
MVDYSNTDTSGRSRLYLDNAATSFPKPPQVLEEMTDYLTNELLVPVELIDFS